MKQLSYETWADIVIKKWIEEIQRLNIGETQQLIDSFQSHVFRESGGDVSRIEFLYNYYGRFVDMGVGRGVPISDVGATGRVPKRWYSGIIYNQIRKLSELMGDEYSRRAGSLIIDTLTTSNKTLNPKP